MKVTLQRIRLNQGGYDRCGAYWGVGCPLYWASYDIKNPTHWDTDDCFFRARDREHAKEIVRTNWNSTGRGLEGATFYN